MEAKAAISDLSHRLPAVPIPLPLAGVIGGKPGPLQFISCAASNASKMNLECGPTAATVKHEAFCIRWKGFQAWLPDGDSQILRLYAFGPSGFKDYGSATLRCKI